MLTYLTGGAFIVDERVNHWGGVVEGGILNLCDYGFDFKYSFIYWHKQGANRCNVRNAIGSRFKNSQWTAIYHLDPEILCVPASLCYGAVLVNHAAKKIPTINKKKNIGWYVGARVGEVCGAGNRAVDFNWRLWLYKPLQIQMCPVSAVATSVAAQSRITLWTCYNRSYDPNRP